MELTLSSEEQQLLLEILEQRHRELLKEISHTDHHQFKQALRKNEQLLDSMLNRLRAAPVQALR
jgi:hypothetical protein